MRKYLSKLTFHQKLVLLSAVPLLGLVGVGGVFLQRVAREYRTVVADQRVFADYADSQHAIERLSRAVQAERLIALQFGAWPLEIPTRTASFKQQVAETDRALVDGRLWLRRLETSTDGASFRESIGVFNEVLATLPDTRREALAGNLNVAKTMAAYSRLPFGALQVAEIHRKLLKNPEALSFYDGLYTVNKMREQDAMIAGLFTLSGAGYDLRSDDFLIIRKQYFALTESETYLRRFFPSLRAYFDGVLKFDPASVAYFKYLADLSSAFREDAPFPDFPYREITLDGLMAKRRDFFTQTIDRGFVLSKEELKNMFLAQRALALGVGGTIVAAIILSLVINLVVASALKHRIATIADEISRAAGDVRSATTQTAGASAQIASNASSYAAALAQIGGAFKEIGETARRNNEHTHHADDLARNANASVDSGRGAIQELGAAMDSIGESSRKITKIVSRINELSFQTNILALNAAIEAARAGEAGAGFSVVAEEVRRLAHQCAAAADETNALIDESTLHANLAVDKSSHVSRVFDEISTHVGEVGAIIAEISRNHGQQSEEIEQANQAVSTQQTVSRATAEVAGETAGTAEQLQSQVATLSHSVQTLNELVGASQRESAGESGPRGTEKIPAPARGGKPEVARGFRERPKSIARPSALNAG